MIYKEFLLTQHFNSSSSLKLNFSGDQLFKFSLLELKFYLFKFSLLELIFLFPDFSILTSSDLLNSQLSEYLSQCSSSYGEAALQLELEQSRILKERLEEQLELLDRNVQTEEEQVVAALDSRLSEVCLELFVNVPPGYLGLEFRLWHDAGQI